MVTVPSVNGRQEKPAAAAPDVGPPAPAPPQPPTPAAPLVAPRPTTEGSLRLAGNINPDLYAEAEILGRRHRIGTRAAYSVLSEGTPEQKSALRNDFRGMLAGARRTQEWLRDPERAKLAWDDTEALAAIDRALQPTRPERSWFGEVGAATGQGFTGLASSYFHLAAASGLLTPEEAARGAAAANRSIRESQAGRGAEVQGYFRRLERAEGFFDTIGTALSSPSNLAILMAEQVGFSSPSLAGGAAGAVAGPIGAAGGAFAGGVLVEMGAWINQELAAAGYDVADPGSLLDAYRDPALMSRVQAEGARKGVGTAAVDALSVLVGGRFLRTAKGQGVMATARAGAKELAANVAIEGGSEAAGQIAAVGAVDTEDVALEMVASLGPGAGEVAIGSFARRDIPAQRQRERVQKAGRALQDAEAVTRAAEAWGQSRLGKRLPEALRAFVGDLVADQDPEVVRAYIDRSAWDAHWRAQDKDPAAELERILPGGREEYQESNETGQVAIPLGSMLEELSGTADMDPLVRISRFRVDGPTVAEVRAEDEEGPATEATVEAESQATELFQERRRLEDEAASLDAQIEALEGQQEAEAPALPEALAPVAEAMGSDQLRSAADLADQLAAGQEVSAEDVAAALSGSAEGSEAGQPGSDPGSGPGEGGSDPAPGPAISAPDALAALQADPGSLSEALRAQADRIDREAQLADLQERRQASQERLDTLEATSPEAEADALADDLTAQLVAAGRPESEARLGATLVAKAFETLAARTGARASDLTERFRVRVADEGRAKGSRLGSTRMAPSDEHGRRLFDVRFWAKANRSTWLHESGHVFLEILGDLAADEGAPKAIQDDYAAILKWLGLDSREAIEEKHHERWARGFEQYLMEGKAPSIALRRAFSAFVGWLKRIYRTVLDLELQLGPGGNIALSDGIRGVMDRLLATDEEIAAAQYDVGVPVLPAEALGKLSEDDRQRILRKAQDAQDEASNRLGREVLQSREQQRRAERGETMDKLREQARADIYATPEAIALFNMRDGTLPGGDPLPDGMGQMKLERAGVLETFEARTVRQLEDLGVVADEGTHPAFAAEEWGFDSPDALANGLLDLADTDKAVERLARARLRVDYPELLTKGQIRSAARSAVANRQRAELLEAELSELKALAREQIRQAGRAGAAEGRATRRAEAAEREASAEKAARGVEAGVRRQAFDAIETIARFRNRARKMLAPMGIREIRPHRYLAAAQRESRRAADRVRVGAYQQAAEAKSRELFHFELYREARALLRQADRDRARLVFMLGKGAQETLTKAGHTYRDQANALLERFELRQISGREAEKRATLAEWAAEREAEGRPLEIPPHVLQEANRKDWKSLTVDELHGLRTTLDGIYHLARTKDELLAAQRGRRIGSAVASMTETIRESRPEREAIVGAETGLERTRELGESFLAGGVKASFWARLMDQDRDGGPVVSSVVRPINEATDAKAALQREAIDEYAGLYDKHFDKDTIKRLNRREDFAGVGLSHEDRLSILSLMGAPEGRRRLRNILTPDQFAAVMGSFTASDVAFVRARYALFDRLFERAQAQHERISGQKPKRVERSPVRLRLVDGTEVELEGGYHPLQYKDLRLYTKQGDEWARDTRAGRAPSAMFDLGYTKERVEEYSGRPRLDRGVAIGHLLNVTHTLAMREAVIDVQAMLQHKDFIDAVQGHYGKATMRGLRDWLVDVAADSGAPRTGLEKAVGFLRRQSVSATLGFRVTSALKQLYGIRQTIVRLGPRWVALGARRWAQDARSTYGAESWIDAKSPFMAERLQGTWQRELNERLGTMPQKHRTGASYFAFYMLSRVQRVVDQVTWIAQYEKTMAEMPAGTDLDAWDVEAVARADQAVKDSQSGGQPVDLSEWERSGPTARLLTMYFTDAGLKFNLTKLAASRTVWKDMGSVARFIGDMTLLYFTEAAIAGAIALALEGADWDEAEEETVRRTLGGMADTLPLVRELSGSIQGYRYQGSAGLSQIPALINAGQQVSQGEMDAALWRSLNTLGGSLFGYPAKAINDAAESIGQVMEGEVPTALIGLRPKE